MKNIGLDAGHGLHTKGKQTPDGIKEWTLNDKVCDKITEMLKDYDCKIIRVDHNEGEVDEPLSQRVNEYIKAGVDAFVSIHHNAYTSSWNSATGVEVYTDRNPLSADVTLANLIYQKITTYTGLKGRGVKKANFAVINQNKVPAVLVEGGFMDSTIDYKVITSDKGQSEYAKAVFESLVEFLKLKKKTAATEKISVIYQTHDDVKNKWLDNVKDKTGYAGNFKNAIDGVLANLTKGNIWYKVHTVGTRLRKGNWLPEVKSREDYAGNFNQPIDAAMFKTDTGKKICYRVHEKASGRWLDPVTGYNEKDSKNGYAGNFGKEIDAIQIWIE